MAQKTLDGRLISIRVPWTQLTPNEKRIYNYLRYFKKGRTEKQIHNAFPDMATVDNRLRDLRGNGWIKDKKQRRGGQLWVVVPK